MGKKIRKKVADTPATVWLKGLAAAALGGAIGGAAEAVQHGFNTHELSHGAIAGAILLTAAYLKTSPLTPAK